jgi:hypothetical protein
MTMRPFLFLLQSIRHSERGGLSVITLFSLQFVFPPSVIRLVAQTTRRALTVVLVFFNDL